MQLILSYFILFILQLNVIMARHRFSELTEDITVSQERYLRRLQKHGALYRNNLVLKRIHHAKRRNATCLDGSDAHYYMSRRSSSKNWVIHLQSGGSCITENECRLRANGPLGSSIPLDYRVTGEWMLSNDPTINPTFHEWNKILIPYCSGDVFVGRQLRHNHPYRLPMLGHYILVAVIEDLIKQYRINRQDVNILFGGTSAGGVGVIANLDYVQELVSPANVKGYVDGGWFTLYPSYGEKQSLGFARMGLPKFFNALTNLFDTHWDGFADESCRKEMPKAAACLYGELAIAYIKTPVYVLSVLWDTYQLRQMTGRMLPILRAPPMNKEEINYYSAFGNNTKRSLIRVLSNPANGIYAPSCYSHTFFTGCIEGVSCGAPIERKYLIRGHSAYDGLSQWYKSNGREGSYMDRTTRDPTCNPSCCTTMCYKCHAYEKIENNHVKSNYVNYDNYYNNNNNGRIVYYSKSTNKLSFSFNLFFISFFLLILNTIR